MPNPEKPGPDARRPRAVRVAFALFTVAIILVSTIAVFEYLNNVSPNQQSAQFPSEPMPALWQSNFSGVPSTIQTSANGTIYFLVDGNTSWSGEVVNWQLYAVQLSSGMILWKHNISLHGPGNAQPQLYLYGGQIYFIGTGSNISTEGAMTNGSNSPYAIYVVQYNQSTGSKAGVHAIGLPSIFSVSGIFAVHGSFLYTAWASWNNSVANVSAYTPFSNVADSTPSWNLTINQHSQLNSTICKPGNGMLFLRERPLAAHTGQVGGTPSGLSSQRRKTGVPIPVIHWRDEPRQNTG